MPEELNESFSRWLIGNEISNFSDMNKLIEYELSTFETWEENFSNKEKEFLKLQEELKNKPDLTADEEAILQMDCSDLTSSDDEEYISFEEEVLQMLLLKIYSKFEIAIKNMYHQKYSKKLTETFKLWKRDYKKNLSVDFESIPGYSGIQTLRIYNNNFKHSGSIISKKTAIELFDNKLLDNIKDCISENIYIYLKKKKNKNIFVKNLTTDVVKLKLSKEKILDLHNQAKNFLKKLYEKIYNEKKGI